MVQTYCNRFGGPALLGLAIVFVGCHRSDMNDSNASVTSISIPHQYSGTPKGEVLQRLQRVGTERPEMILGQNIGCTCNSIAELENAIIEMRNLTDSKRIPQMIGIDYGWGDMNADDIRNANRILIDHWKRGGLITINFDPGNPTTGKPDPNDVTPFDLRRITLPGTAENLHFNRQLRIVAEGLGQLQRAGVTVLWRPIHEPNGGWFWWCSHDEATKTWTPPEHYKTLWQYIHHELTVGYGLNNLIWVYSPASMANEWIRPTDLYYPGDKFVDIIGVDLYTDSFTPDSFDAQKGFTALRKFGKPLAICEFGSHRLDGTFDAHLGFEAALRLCPDAKYILFWHSWNDGSKRIPMAIVDSLNGNKLLADPRALTLTPNEFATPRESTSDREEVIQRFLDHSVTH